MDPGSSVADPTSAQDSPPVRLNVGCGRNIMPGWLNLDSADLPGVDLRADLEECARVPIPLADNSVDEFLLSHVIEHIRGALPLMQELHRIAKPDAVMTIQVPHGASDDAWEDPTHIRGYFQGSFFYFSQPAYWRADYGYRGDWQTEHVICLVDAAIATGMSAAEVQAHVNKYRNVVKALHATLRAVKPVREPLRALAKAPKITFQLV
jgi:SAM-dependent methyltransferase